LQGVFERRGEGCEETTLASEVDLLPGFAFKSAEYTDNESDIRLLRGDNIVQGAMRWVDVKRWRASEFDIHAKFQLRENDIVLAMDRPWVKAGLKCARLTKEDLPALLVQRTSRLRNKSRMDGTFLYHLIRSKQYSQHLLGVQTGIGVPHISASQILSFKFFMPPLAIQQNIVQKLDTLAAETKRLEAIYRQKIASLDELKKTLLQKAFQGELKTERVVV
jgi:type I restriction enzyme S subunit